MNEQELSRNELNEWAAIKIMGWYNHPTCYWMDKKGTDIYRKDEWYPCTDQKQLFRVVTEWANKQDEECDVRVFVPIIEKLHVQRGDEDLEWDMAYIFECAICDPERVLRALYEVVEENND